MSTAAAGVQVNEGRVEVLGIPVDSLSMDESLLKIEALIAAREPSLVVTADASGLVIANEDSEFGELIRHAALVTADSSGVAWALRRKGRRVEQVSGVELLDRICALSADKGYRLYFLGAAPGIAEEAAERLRLKHPGVNIVGTRNGFFPAESDAVVASEIGELSPDVIFVAMGMPRQEKFIWNNRQLHRAPIGIGVGGSFDVFSGRTKRAPKIIQQIKLEWLWRLILNPKKISKVKYLPIFVWRVLKDRA